MEDTYTKSKGKEFEGEQKPQKIRFTLSSTELKALENGKIAI
jgi:hypothetical protein